MPSSSLLWTLPRPKRGPPQPGFTDEELQYLETTLQIIESISLDTLCLTEDDEAEPKQATAKAARQLVQPSQSRHSIRTQSAISEAKLWAATHPNTVAMFLVFLASALLARNGGSIQAIIGITCLFAGLKIMAASEDGFEQPPKENLLQVPTSKARAL